jgi:hypothetical protein
LDRVLQAAEDRYVLYLELLLSLTDTPTNSLPLPPWDVALVLHAHLLSPNFIKDFSTPLYAPLVGRLDLQLFRYASRLQNLRFGDENSGKIWSSMYPGIPFQIFEITEDIYRGRNPFFARLISLPPSQSSQPSSSRFSLNLAEAVTRQWEFSRKITDLYPQDPVGMEILNFIKTRYIKFMNLMRDSQQVIVPTLEIDLFWHTHQLSSVNYDRWCWKHFGRRIQHDDTMAEGPLTDGLRFTKQAWMESYYDDYLAPTPVSYTQQPDQNQKLIRPPANLTPPQKALWDFDLDKQRRHDEFEYALLQLSERKELVNLNTELSVAEEELREAMNAFEAQYQAEMAARAASQGRPGIHPDMPASYQGGRIGLRKLKEMDGVLRRIKAAKDAAQERAVGLQRSKVQAIKNRITTVKEPIYSLIFRNTKDRAEWRLERFKILQWTGALYQAERKEPGLFFSKTIPAVSGIEFPLYAASWYASAPLGAYDYSDRLSLRCGRKADGYLCGAKMDGGKPPVVYISSCGSGGGG